MKNELLADAPRHKKERDFILGATDDSFTLLEQITTYRRGRATKQRLREIGRINMGLGTMFKIAFFGGVLLGFLKYGTWTEFFVCAAFFFLIWWLHRRYAVRVERRER